MPRKNFLFLFYFCFILLAFASSCAPVPSGQLAPTASSGAKGASFIKAIQTQHDSAKGELSAQIFLEGQSEPVALSGTVGKNSRVTLLAQGRQPFVAEAYCLDPLNCARVLVDVYAEKDGKILKRQFASDNLAQGASSDEVGVVPDEFVGFPLSAEGRKVLGVKEPGGLTSISEELDVIVGESPQQIEKRLGPWLRLREGGIAIGTAQTVKIKNADGSVSNHYGSLKNATLLPEEGPSLKRVSSSAYGTGFMISLLQGAAAEFGWRFKTEDLVRVGGISKQMGGLFPPHKSHQNGMDADVLYIGTKDWGSVVENGKVTEKFNAEKNWEFWRLLYRQRILENGKPVSIISMILVDPVIKTHLCAWAKGKGMLNNPENLEIMRRVRPTVSHDDHFHIRTRCSPHHPLCRRENIAKSECPI